MYPLSFIFSKILVDKYFRFVDKYFRFALNLFGSGHAPRINHDSDISTVCRFALNLCGSHHAILFELMSQILVLSVVSL